MDNLAHIKAGDPIRAPMLNAVIDGAKITRNLSKSGAVKGTAAKHTNVLVRILNNTGEDLNRFSVVALSEPLFEPDNDVFFQEPAFRGTKPNSETKSFAILQTRALQEEIVYGCVAGVSVVKIDVQNESDEFVTPKDETTMSSSAEGVARIIWKESGSGEKWGLVLYPVGGSGGGESKIYAVVMSAIHCPSDPTLDPDDSDFREAMGEIKIEGKSYPPLTDENGDPILDENEEYTYQYDKCACRELAGKDDEYPEQIVKGTQIEVIKAGSYDNPDYEPPDENGEGGNNEPEKLDWYLAVGTEGIYEGKIADEITGAAPDTTIDIKDSDNTDVTLSVHATALGSTQKIEADSGVIVTRLGNKLVIIKSRCPT
jgi:hypothetical protein